MSCRVVAASSRQQQRWLKGSVLGWHSTWTMDRLRRCYWVPTTVSRPNTSRLLLVGNLEEWSLSAKASHTEHATRNNRNAMCSHHTRHTDSRSSHASTLFSRWWWSLRAHLTLSPRKNYNDMSLCSKDIDYQRVSTFFGPLCIYIYIYIRVCVCVLWRFSTATNRKSLWGASRSDRFYTRPSSQGDNRVTPCFLLVGQSSRK
jgi:hypothetical protein